MRRFTSWLAGFHPNVVFFSRKTRIKLNGILQDHANRDPQGNSTPLIRAALAISAAVGENMVSGDVAEITLTDIFDGHADGSTADGSFHVTIKKL